MQNVTNWLAISMVYTSAHIIVCLANFYKKKNQGDSRR